MQCLAIGHGHLGGCVTVVVVSVWPQKLAAISCEQPATFNSCWLWLVHCRHCWWSKLPHNLLSAARQVGKPSGTRPSGNTEAALSWSLSPVAFRNRLNPGFLCATAVEKHRAPQPTHSGRPEHPVGITIQLSTVHVVALIGGGKETLSVSSSILSCCHHCAAAGDHRAWLAGPPTRRQPRDRRRSPQPPAGKTAASSARRRGLRQRRYRRYGHI